MLKLSANLSMLFTECPLLERFQAAADAGFHAVEIQFPYDEQPQDLKQAADSAGLPVILINVPVADFMQGGNGLACVPGKEEAFKQALEHALTYAAVLQPACMNVLAGRIPAGVSREDALQTYIGNLRYAAEQMAQHGIRCVFEAINAFDIPAYPVTNIQQSQDVLLAVSHPNLALQFDVYHMSRMDEPVCQTLQQMGDQIGHIQFADVPGRGEPGTGEIDFAQIFECIEGLPYNGWAGAEYNPVEATDQSLGWLQELKQ